MDQRVYVEDLLLSLRDFFMATGARDLAQAYAALDKATSQSAPPVSDWNAVEFAFNRLFVGPKTLVAPPYASVYLEPEPQLMGETTLRIRALYRVLDRSLPWQDSIPDDHISFELDVYRQLYVATRRLDAAELESVRHYLLDHMARWVPVFVESTRHASDLPPAICFVVDCLSEWLAVEIASNFQRDPVLYFN